MVTIQEHYDIELAKEKPNQAQLSKLLKVLDQQSITLSEWRLTGKFTPKNEFLADNPTEKLLNTCREVIEYFGKGYIQVLKSGTFRYNSSIKSKVLDDVENKMWNEVAEKLWCSEC